MNGLQARWQTLAPRERSAVLLAAAVVGAAVLWWVALAPALRVLASAPAQQQRVGAQLQQMRALADEARALQSQPRLSPDDALRALETSVRARLGAQAQISAVGDRVTVTLRGVPPDVLAAWLAHARSVARALPVEARLQRGSAGWDGSLVLQLPGR